MEIILSKLAKQIIFWMAWIIIPLIVEIIPSIGNFFILIKKKIKYRKKYECIKMPQITVIVPVYNSRATLRNCIKSIHDSTYPNELIDVLLVNNMSPDDSYSVFLECQKEFKELNLMWLNARQGKAKALNLALFNSGGKYIINIDSDGVLHKDALENMVLRFEQDQDTHCMTGVILIDESYIEATTDFMLKLVRRCEFFEYAQAFLAGRNFECEHNQIYTLSGAFSAFRKSAILKTQLYNSTTVCEDTHITFQVRKLLEKNVHLCENAMFFVDPIDNYAKLYTQRQRWQRGEIEVAHIYLYSQDQRNRKLFINILIKLLLFDHTFAFPRMIWYFALIFLVFMNYSFSLIVSSVFIIYLLYVLSAFLFFINIILYLGPYKDIKAYYQSKWYLIFFLPVFNFVVFWIRLAGIINSIKSKGQWKTLDFYEEWHLFCEVVKKDFSGINSVLRVLRSIVNNK